MKAVYWLITALAVHVAVAVHADEIDNLNQFNMPPTVRLNDGREMPIVGLGTAFMSSNQARQSVMDAIDRGYRHFDTAHIYGTEVGVGEGVNAKIAEGVVRREDIFVVSKLWNTFHDPQLVRGAVEESLRRLNFAYVDLYLIHWPMSYSANTNFDLLDTWRALETLVDEGMIMSIGISNFNISQVNRIVDNARIQPVTNQIEVHPHCLNKRLIEHCRSRHIVVTAYSPLGVPGHPQFNPDSRLVINEVVIRAIATRLQRTPAQILTRYSIQTGNVAIPKTIWRERIINNFSVFDFTLTDEDIREIESIGFYFRTAFMAQDQNHREYPFDTFECF